MSKIMSIMGVLILLSGLLGGFPTALAGSDECPENMPPNPEKIAAALIARGAISPDATQAEIDAAVAQYLQLKLAKCRSADENNVRAQKKINAAEVALNLYHGEINGRKLGYDQVFVEPSTPQFKPLEGTEKLLLILVDFSDVPQTWETVTGETRTEAGPLHNQITLPDNDFDLWVPDFSTTHYQNMLFTPGGWTLPDDHPYYPGEKRGSMRDYFLEQSYGVYTVEGDAHGWFTVPMPEAYYGDDHPDGGSDNLLPGTPRTMIADAVEVINASNAIDWLDYDLLDLYDMDQDGETNEPDCIIDHPLFIHAGIDQSGGGGAQGDDSLWAHSASTELIVTSAKNDQAVCPEDWPGTMLYNYTLMPEDGGVGVFAHEFAHDLGLPDEYDTIYSGGGASQGFWTLQASGSWIGRPAQTQPSAMSIWARYVLGWVNPVDNLAEIGLEDLSKEPLVLRLEQSELWGGEGTINAVKVRLPDKEFYVNDPVSGLLEWFGGKADQIDTTLRRTVDLTGKTSAELSFWTWYDIEEEWDYGFVQVSIDGGVTWTSLPIEGTTMEAVPDAMPEIVANLPGFTGNSGGWVQKTHDLSAYAGQVIELQFRYMTDWGTSLAGYYLDDIGVTADSAPVFFDDVETLDVAWVTDGWTQEAGSGTKPHYYIMEWRNLQPMEVDYNDATLVNFDAGLNDAYQFDSYSAEPNQPLYFSYAPGLLMYYRDMTYTDNWTGVHPGGGFLLIVDAHDRPLFAPSPTGAAGGLTWSSRIQSYDAAFGLDRVPDITLSYFDKLKTLQGLNAVPNFKDNHLYWNSQTPYASVITPEYGFLFRVLGQAEDRSATAIAFGSRYELAEEFINPMSDFFAFWENTFMPILIR